MYNVFIGIDPGISGGIAILRDQGVNIGLVKFKGQTEEEISELFSTIRTEVVGRRVILYMEKVHAMPKQGVVSTFKFGMSYGFLRGLCVANNFTINDVTPQRWQTVLNCRTGGNKNVTKYKAQRLFPAIAHRITHAVADALMLAVYAEKEYYGRRA